ncbi:hypothetical protein KOR34_21200 [Posidoniimonas corsicana]|uniref:LamG-like jellyroll fold domain-containing protein n=1 Tax=Posidoniimonas corsicana TaxID=1938618 RepID=A0A5C5VGJ5_9BACT|nr:LamG domain-containing protein [Posidoniimonas corsicana]TWT37173.1 hypothetical protein KOR34_21200 [Posidoniimonas corsicana]
MRALTLLTSLGLLTLTPYCSAGALALSGPQARIFITDQTDLGNLLTVEARVLFDDTLGSFGMLFNEWQLGVEDKQIRLGPSRQRAYMLGLTAGNFDTTVELQRDAWHHVAWTSNGVSEHWYINGQLISSRALTGTNVRDSPQGLPRIGSISRDDALQPAMNGYVDWLRITKNNLYSGDSFLPPGDNVSAVGGTVLLYNFNDVGAESISNEAGAAHQGTLDSFAQIVPSPNAPPLGDLTGDGQIGVADISAITLAIRNPDAYSLMYPGVDRELVGDLNSDHVLDELDRDALVGWLGVGHKGDYNLDGLVDTSDYVAWRASYGSSLALDADGNQDSFVDAADYTVWRDNPLSLTGSPHDIPEPCSACLACIVGVVLCRPPTRHAFCSAAW